MKLATPTFLKGLLGRRSVTKLLKVWNHCFLVYINIQRTYHKFGCLYVNKNWYFKLWLFDLTKIIENQSLWKNTFHFGQSKNCRPRNLFNLKFVSLLYIYIFHIVKQNKLFILYYIFMIECREYYIKLQCIHCLMIVVAVKKSIMVLFSCRSEFSVKGLWA